jgi:hypothetical protein
MADERKERWFQLCQLASVEQDQDKLLALVREVNLLLENEELKHNRSVRRNEWNQVEELDKHQNEARQPYRSREHNSADSFLKSVEPSGKKKSDDPEQNSE